MKVDLPLAKTPAEEQETIINRCRADENKIYIYSSDTRVMRRILNLSFPDTAVRVSKHDKKVTAIECTLQVKDFLRHNFLPTHRINKRIKK